MPILMILRATWKIWLPTLAIVLIAGTIWAQGKRINHLREERDVAISEYQRAMVVAQAAAADREKLDRLLQERQRDAESRERKLSRLWRRLRSFLGLGPMFAIGLTLLCLPGCGPKFIIQKIPPPSILLMVSDPELIEPKTNGELLGLYLSTRKHFDSCNADKRAIAEFYREEK
jgi:hypothetical protein